MWVVENSKTKPNPVAIEAWSAWGERRAPSDVESRQHFNPQQAKYGPQREEIVTWFDLLDPGDYVSFGAKA